MTIFGRVEVEYEEASRDLRFLNRISTLIFRVLESSGVCPMYSLCTPIELHEVPAIFDELFTAQVVYAPPTLSFWNNHHVFASKHPLQRVSSFASKPSFASGYSLCINHSRSQLNTLLLLRKVAFLTLRIHNCILFLPQLEMLPQLMCVYCN